MEVEKRNPPDFDEESISDEDCYKEEQNDQATQFEEEFLRFMNKKKEKPDQPKTLGDLIAEKIKERREQLNRDLDQDNPAKKVDKNVLELYKEVGVILSKYTSGKLPKAFKVSDQICFDDPVQPDLPAYQFSCPFKGHSITCKLGTAPAADQAGEMVIGGHVRGDQNVHRQPERATSPEVFEQNSAAAHSRRHTVRPKAEHPSLQVTTKGSLQTGRLLQGNYHSALRVWRLFAQGGIDRRLDPGPKLDSHSPFVCGNAANRRDDLHWSEQSVFKFLDSKTVRTAVPGD